MPSILDGLNLPGADERPLRQKWEVPTRADEKNAAEKLDAAQLETWRGFVFTRDRHTCRCCEVKVLRTLALRVNRAEAHHIVSRSIEAVRYDVRNGICLCYKCHRRVTGMVNDKLIVVGAAFFVIGDTHYIDGTYPVHFQEAA